MLLIYDNFNFLSYIKNEFFIFTCMSIDINYGKKLLNRYKFMSMISEPSIANLLNLLFEKHIGVKKTNVYPTYDIFDKIMVFIPDVRKRDYTDDEILKIKNENLYKLYFLTIEDYHSLENLNLNFND